MISSETWQGKQMKGEVLSILGKERPMSPLNSSSTWRSWTGMERHRIPSGGCIGGVIAPPPIKNRVNFCGGHFDLSGGDNHFSKEPILFTALVSRTAKRAMKYSGTISINRCNSRTLCAEGGVCTGLGEHMDPMRRGLQEAVHKTRNTIVHILHLLQIISSVASGPRCHAWQGVAVNSITYDVCRKTRSWNYRTHHLRTI